VFGVVEKQKVSKDDIFTSIIPVLWRLQTAYTENGVGTLNDEKHQQVVCTGIVCHRIQEENEANQRTCSVQHNFCMRLISNFLLQAMSET